MSASENPGPAVGYGGVRKPVLVLVLLILVCGAGCYWGLYLPMTRRIDRAQTRVDTARARIAAATKQAQKMDGLRKENAELSSQVKAFESMLPTVDALPYLVKETGACSAGAKIGLRAIEFGRPVLVGDYAEVPLSVTVADGYGGLLAFLALQSKLNRVIVARGFRILGRGESQTLVPGSSSVEARLELAVCVRPEGVKGGETKSEGSAKTAPKVAPVAPAEKPKQ